MDEDVERYIAAIRWHKDTPDYEKGLVAANIRAYHAYLRLKGALKGTKDGIGRSV